MLEDVKKDESFDSPNKKPNQIEEGSLMVDFSPPSFLFIRIDFIPKDSEDEMEDRENSYNCIVEGDLVLECNEVDIHQIIEFVLQRFFSLP